MPRAASATLFALAHTFTFAGPSIAADPAVTHRVLGADRGKVAVVGHDGTVEWSIANAFGGVHDLRREANGNIVYQSGPASITEVTPEKKVVWTYNATPVGDYKGRVEIHSFSPAGPNLLIAESGNKRLIEVDRSGKVVKEVPLKVERPDPHRDTRRARKLDNGHYLVCHEGDGVVREYDGDGKIVWSYALDLAGRPRTPGHDGHGTEVFSAIRKSDGNTLIATGNGNRVIEVTPEGKTVWSIEQDELPGIKLAWVTTLQLLKNGNIVVGNCHAGPENPQLFEVTRDKKVVWAFKDFKTFGNDLASAVVLDAE